MAAISETGAQLFARLGEKPSLARLNPKLIPPGLEPRPGDVVEVYGSSGSGKTELLLNLTATCVLPEQWKGIDIGGLGTSVVFVDTDHQFSMLRLFALLEHKVTNAIHRMKLKDNIEDHDQGKARTCVGSECPDKNSDGIDRDACVQQNTKVNIQCAPRTTPSADQSTDGAHYSPPSEEEVEGFIKACLKRLYIVKIASSNQLVITLHSLESLLASQCDISVLMMDSVSAFYWLDRMKGDGAQHQGVNQKLAFTILSRLVQDYHLVLFATKAALVAKQPQHEFWSRLDSASETDCSHQTSSTSSLKLSTEHHEFMGQEWTKLVTHRLVLEHRDHMTSNGPISSFMSALKHKTSGNMYSCQFTIDEQGIQEGR
nr:DNA repair protein XRCC2-like [Lytechinus pictus]